LSESPANDVYSEKVGMTIHYSDGQVVTGYVGGVIPVYLESGADYDAACSCEIGTYVMMRHGLKRYDSLPGTSSEDTKHSVIMAHYERLRDAA
jgi:hypothetical protein